MLGVQVAPRRKPQGLVHQLFTSPPPVLGINSTGAIADMPPTDALDMDNIVSTDLGVAVREGWREYATNISAGAPIRTVVSYEGGPANATVSPLAESQLFAMTDAGIFDIEGGGNMTGDPAMIALSGVAFAGRMSCVQFTTSAGQFLVACSETDGGYLYNGVAWMKMTSVGGPGPGIITGVDPTLFVQVCAYKKRLMFVERGSSRAWFLAVDSVGGAASVFDFGPLLVNGGALLALVNWTQDAGAGTDDRLVVLGSSGDLAIYQGNDPSSAANFANVGTWYIGQPPIGRRCFTTSGGNVFVLTQYGVIPVNQVVQGGLDNILTSDTTYLVQLRKLQDTLNRDFATLLNTIGWELLALPSKAMLHIARPPQSVTDAIQYAYQQHSLAWSRFLDVPGVTFGARLNEVYAGTSDGRVLRVFNGYTDGMRIDGTNAQEIRARLTPAFNYLGDPSTVKQMLMMRCNFLATQAPAYSLVINTDFSLNPIGQSPVAGGVVGSLWDASYWDQAIWSGGRASFSEWRGVEGMGYALSPSIYISAEVNTTLASIEYMFRPGGPL